MTWHNPDDATLTQLLRESRTIAVFGHSDKPYRTSYQIAQYLRRAGYQVYPVNPTVTEIDHEPVAPDVASVPEPVDIVDVFRRSDFAGEAVDQAIAAGAKAVWLQLDVVDEAAAERARRAGLIVVMDRCIKVDHARLLG